MAASKRVSRSAASFPLWWPALGYLLFVVYGSLVPLQTRPLAFADAWQRFSELATQQTLRTSTVDWAVNIVLYVPLCFFWLGALWHRWRLGARLGASLLVLAFGMLVSAGIEFAQLYVPSRTSSFNDIIANSLGSALGVLAWWLFGQRARDWFAGLHGSVERAQLLQKLLLAYLVLLCGYNLMPLDLSVSPVEIYHKWKAGLVRLVPFAHLPAEPAQAMYALSSEAGLWAVAAWLAQRSGLYPAGRILLGVTGAAALIEILQLFVMSRVSDTTGVILAFAGGAAGLWLGRLGGGRPVGPLLARHRGLLLAGWAALVLAVLWYPYRFDADWRTALVEIDQTLAAAPLLSYYQNSELGALTSMLRKLLLFLPFGLLLRLRQERPAVVAVQLPALALVLLVEFGQALQPGKVGDVADLLLQLAGIAAGWWLGGLLQHAAQTPAVPAAPPKPAPVASPSRAETWPWLLGAAALLLFVAGLLLPRMSALPYNLRELIAADTPVLSALGLCLGVYWIAAAPLLATPLLARGSRWLAGLLLWPLLHGTGAFLLLWLAVPAEALDDVLGSPVLGWSWQWERLLRFIALFSVGSVWLTGAVLLAGRQRLGLDRRVAPIWWLAAMMWLPLAYWGVVAEAATDNLIELIAGEAAWWAAGALGAALALFLIVVVLAGRWLAGRPSRRWWGLPALLLALPLVYGLVWLGSEPRLFKYGQVFSALQFVLSSDRQHYLEPDALLGRFALAYSLAALGLLLVQLPFWQWLCRRADRLAAAAAARRQDSSA